MHSFPNLEPAHFFASGSNCCFLTCIQISQEAGKVVWYPHLFKNFPLFVVIHAVKGFDVVNKAEVSVFLELSCFFYDPTDFGNLISGSSAFSKSSLNIWKFSVHVLLKPHLENFEHCFASIWDECNCTMVWTFFGIAFLWYWNENWTFPVLWPLLSFPDLMAYCVQHFHSIIFQDLSYFKSWKMMLWKCCTQYASKFGKLSSGHRTGKGQFSFQYQRKAMPKNAQTTTQLHSSHTLVK